MASEPAAAPPAAKAHDGNTSFLRAARSGNLDKVLEHLKNNVDINTSNTNGLNALHLGAKDGHVNVVAELLKRGAIVDNATKKGNTALHIASLAGQEDVVKLLLQHHASVNAQSQNGFTPLYMASQENHDSVVRLLLSNGANQSLATEDGFTPLAVAMQQGHDKVVAILLESDTRGKVRLPALHIAAKKDDVKAATLLLENDHNPDVTSKSGFTPLHIASHYGNESIANLLIQNGADVNFAAKHNISPLHVTAKWGKTNMVSLLLEKGANIDSKTRDGLTPLHCAARSGHEQVVDMLLERGAPISAKTKNGLAPLHMAAQGEHVDAARILLYHRAPVDEVTVDYLTALHVAAHCGHVRVAKLLLDRNADANARALNGFTPLHIACKKNRIKVVELLLKHGASISATTESGLTPLHVASFMGCMNIVIYLLQHEASPDVPTVRGETPLHLAARANQTDIIRILLRNGAQVDARAREQQTPLHIASRLGNVDIVMLLLQHGAQVDATTKDMYTALHIAAKEGQDEVIGALIENNASLDATTKKGLTPLHIAAKYGHRRVTELLLQKGAAVDAQGKNGVTPLHVAAHYDHQAVALLLLGKGASPHAMAKNGHTPLHIAARKNQMDIASALLEYKALADSESKAGFTPLHLAAQEGHIEMAELLLEHRAQPNQAARNGLTPMHLCAQEDRTAVAQLLCKHGAHTEAVTKAGFTPLHVAAHFGQANMVRFLLQQQQSGVNATTSIGYTPLHHAAQQGQSHVCQVLLENGGDPNALTENGQTPVQIAQRLGYISVIETLKTVSDQKHSLMQTSLTENGEKYCVVAPESMQEFFMSDSEEEGDENTTDQPYRYLTVDEMRSLGDDSLPIDVTRDERVDSNRMAQSTDSANMPPTAIEDAISPQHGAVVEASHSYVIDSTKFDTTQKNYGKFQWKNFLVSFLVDARGGALRGCRHSGIRIIVPARSASQPTRITCRYVKPQRNLHPPQLMEGEALASRVLELGPVGVKFIGPVVIEVPHFASLRAKEREIVVLRSDNGETWREHSVDQSEEILQDILTNCFESDEYGQTDDLLGGRICRFVTYDFPQYFAVVSRIRQEVHAIGPEGGMVSSTVVPQVQAVFPQGALTKKIKVGLQAQPIDPNLTAKLLGRGVAVSPIVTVEPRRRKFHKAITLSMPAPKAHSQGMINQYSGNAPTLRLLCSITGGPSRAQWEDVTGSTPLTFVNDCVSFTTTVSARFWLMDCRNIADATKMATDLYREAIYVPFMAKLVVFAKRLEPLEARLRVFCMTDDREDKTLEAQQHFTQVAKSRDVEVIEGKTQYIELAGNLIPVTKSGEQLHFAFKAFRENRLPFSVRVKDQHADLVGRALFMREPRVAKGEQPQQPICILNIVLPEQSDAADEPQAPLKVTIRTPYATAVPPPIASKCNGSSTESVYYLRDLRIADIANLIGADWLRLAPEIGISADEVEAIRAEHPVSDARQAQAMLRLFQSREPEENCLARLEAALQHIERENILRELKRNTSAEVAGRKDKLMLELDEKDHMKTSESVEELVVRAKKDRRLPAHDFDELKYSAEEKTIVDESDEASEEEDETVKKTVADRRAQISKRLSVERQIPASSQKKEIVQEISEIKRHSFIEDKRALHEEEINLRATTVNVIKPSGANAEQIMKIISARKEDAVGGGVSKSDMDRELENKFSSLKDEQDSAVVLGEFDTDGAEDDEDATQAPTTEAEEVHITSVETLVKMHERSQFVQESSEKSQVTSKVVMMSADDAGVIQSETVQKHVEVEQQTGNKTIVHEEVLTKTNDRTSMEETTLKSEQNELVKVSSDETVKRSLHSGMPTEVLDAARAHDVSQDSMREESREQTAEAELDDEVTRAYVKFAEETKEEHNVLETGIHVEPVDAASFLVEDVTSRVKRTVESNVLEEAFHTETVSYKETEKESTFLDSDVESERDTEVPEKDAGIFSEEHSVTEEVTQSSAAIVKEHSTDASIVNANLQSFESESTTTSLITEKVVQPKPIDQTVTIETVEQDRAVSDERIESSFETSAHQDDLTDMSPERDIDTDDLRRSSDDRKQSGSSMRAGDYDWDLSQNKPTPEQLQTPDETAITDINIDSGISVKVTEEMVERHGDILEETFVAEPASFEKSEKDNTFSMSSMESDPEISVQCVDQSADVGLDEDEESVGGEHGVEHKQKDDIVVDQLMSDTSKYMESLEKGFEQTFVSSSYTEYIGQTKSDKTEHALGKTPEEITALDNLAVHAPELEDLPEKVVFTIGQPEHDDDLTSLSDHDDEHSFIEHSETAITDAKAASHMLNDESEPLSLDSSIFDGKQHVSSTIVREEMLATSQPEEDDEESFIEHSNIIEERQKFDDYEPLSLDSTRFDGKEQSKLATTDEYATVAKHIESVTDLPPFVLSETLKTKEEPDVSDIVSKDAESVTLKTAITETAVSSEPKETITYATEEEYTTKASPAGSADDAFDHSEIVTKKITTVTEHTETIVEPLPTHSTITTAWAEPKETSTTVTQEQYTTKGSADIDDDVSDRSEIVTKKITTITEHTTFSSEPKETTVVTQEEYATKVSEDIDDDASDRSEIVTKTVTVTEQTKTTAEPLLIHTTITTSSTKPDETTTTVTREVFNAEDDAVDDYLVSEHSEIVTRKITTVTTEHTETIAEPVLTQTTITTVTSGPIDTFTSEEHPDIVEFVSDHSEILTRKITTVTERTATVGEPLLTTTTITTVSSDPFESLKTSEANAKFETTEKPKDTTVMSETKTVTEHIETVKEPLLTHTTIKTYSTEPESITTVTHEDYTTEDHSDLSDHSEIVTRKVTTVTEHTEIVSEPILTHTIITKISSEPKETAESIVEPLMTTAVPHDDEDESDRSEIVTHKSTTELIESVAAPLLTHSSITTAPSQPFESLADLHDGTTVQQTTIATKTTTTEHHFEHATVEPKLSEELFSDRSQSQMSFDRQTSVESTTTDTDAGKRLVEQSSFISEPDSISQSLGLEEAEVVMATETIMSGKQEVVRNVNVIESETSVTATTDDEPASSQATTHGVDTEFDHSADAKHVQSDASLVLDSKHPEPEFHTTTQTHVLPKPTPRISTTTTTITTSITNFAVDHSPSGETIPTTVDHQFKRSESVEHTTEEHDEDEEDKYDKDHEDDDDDDDADDHDDRDNERIQTSHSDLNLTFGELRAHSDAPPPSGIPVPKPRTIHSSAGTTNVTITATGHHHHQHHETSFTRTASASPELMRASSQHSSETFVNELRVEFSDGSGNESDPKNKETAAPGGTAAAAAAAAIEEKEPATIDECMSIVSDHEDDDGGIMQDEIVSYGGSNTDFAQLDRDQMGGDSVSEPVGVQRTTGLDSEPLSEDEEPQAERKTSFYIGESKENIIKKTYSDGSPGSRAGDFADEAEPSDGEHEVEECVDEDVPPMPVTPVQETIEVAQTPIDSKKDEPEHSEAEVDLPSIPAAVSTEETVVEKPLSPISTHVNVAHSPISTNISEQDRFEVTEEKHSMSSKFDLKLDITDSFTEDVDHSKRDQIDEHTDAQHHAEPIVKHDLKLDITDSHTEDDHSDKVSAAPQQQHDDAAQSESQQDEADQTMVNQAFEEVQESLKAVHDDLVEVVKDGRLKKESPSEFSFKMLPDIKFPQLEAHHEELHILSDPLTETCVEMRSASVEHSSAAVAAESVDTIQEVTSSAIVDAAVVGTKDHTDSSTSPVSAAVPTFVPAQPTNRWSTSEREYCSSSASQYESMEKTETGPNSSDIDFQMSGISEYQTANDPSLGTVDSSEYQTAVVSLDPSSVCSSLPSFNSESSGNLGSIDISDASETLMPDVVSDEDEVAADEEEEDEELVDEEEHEDAVEEDDVGDHSESELNHMRTDERSDEVLQLQQDLEALRQSPSMKRSQEMHFDKIQTETQSAAPQDEVSQIISAHHATEAHSSILEDFMAAERAVSQQSIASEAISTAVTTTTTSTTSEETSSEAPAKRSKGHKRSDSTVFLKNLEAMKQIEDEVTANIADEVADFPSSGSVSEDLQARSAGGSASASFERAGSESDSDNDRYETEYTRSFRQPAAATFKKMKKNIEVVDTQVLERKKSIPSIETIAEDVVAEVDAEMFLRGVVSQNMSDYSAGIPDITVSEDPTPHYDIDDEVGYHSEAASETDLPEQPSVTTTGSSVVTTTSSSSTIVNKSSVVSSTFDSKIKISEAEFKELIEIQSQKQEKIASAKYSFDDPAKADSPTSDSFEILDQPDITDEFVIIEEVAKEANEFDSEGKGVSIQMAGKFASKHDTEVEAILVRSAPAATNEGSIVFQGHSQLDFDFDDNGHLIGHESSGTSTHHAEDDASSGIDSSRKWVEMQLAEQAQNLRYPYDMERGILEDIKEEDTDMEVGSSRLSSFKDSFSSTPEHDVMARQRGYAAYAAAAAAAGNGKGEHDNMSVNSLQEFENLEQAISLENRRFQHGSQDSSSGSSLSRRYHLRTGAANGDDCSGSSLKEFEGMEEACVEAHLMDLKVKEEVAMLLSRSDESDPSPSNKEPFCVRKTAYQTTATTTTTMTTVVTVQPSEAAVVGDQFETKALDAQQLCGSTDSLEMQVAARDPLARSIDSIDVAAQREGDLDTKSTRSNSDSLEQLNQLVRTDSADSIDAAAARHQSTTTTVVTTASGRQQTTTTSTTVQQQGAASSSATSSYSPCSLTGADDREMSKEMSCDSLCEGGGGSSEPMLTSVESLSSTTTNATYQNVNDSQMSDSTTSCCSNTMIDTLEGQFAAAAAAGSLSGLSFDVEGSISSASGASSVVTVRQETTLTGSSGMSTSTTTTTTTTQQQQQQHQMGPRDVRPADF